MRIAIILLAMFWGMASVVAFAKGRNRGLDARLSSAYILLYPVLVVGLILNDPVPMWLSVPVAFGFIPWLLAGPHLWRILSDPSHSRADELIGIPRPYWAWGGLGALLLGLVFS